MDRRIDRLWPSEISTHSRMRQPRGASDQNRALTHWPLRRRRDDRLGDVCHSLRSPYMWRFSSASLSKTSGIIAVSTPVWRTLALSVALAVPLLLYRPFLRRTPPRTANRPFPGTSEFDWQSSVWVGATARITGGSMPLECFLTDRSPVLGAPPSSSRLEMALLWFERFGFLFVIWLNPHDHTFRWSDRLRYMSCPV